jgi:hypothetical protein
VDPSGAPRNLKEPRLTGALFLILGLGRRGTPRHDSGVAEINRASGTTTIESKTNFVGAAKEGSTVIATATPLHRGRRTQVWQTRLETEEGRLVALVTQNPTDSLIPFRCALFD